MIRLRYLLLASLAIVVITLKVLNAAKATSGTGRRSNDNQDATDNLRGLSSSSSSWGFEGDTADDNDGPANNNNLTITPHIIESLPCEKDHKKAVKFVGRFGDLTGGNEDCLAEADPDSCSNGCCRFGMYFLCDTTNSYVDRPCVCGRNTNNNIDDDDDKHQGQSRDGEGIMSDISNVVGDVYDSVTSIFSYDIGAVVTVVGQAEWGAKVMNNASISMVSFAAPWCMASQNLYPEYREAASSYQLATLPIQLVWLDATNPDNANFVSQFDVRGYPKIMIFKAGTPKDSNQAYQYEGPHTAPELVKAVLAEFEGDSSSDKPQEETQTTKTTTTNPPDTNSKTVVVVQGQEAWDREVFNNPQVTMIAFIAPWCPGSQALQPEYDSAASQLDGGAKLVWVDATDAINTNFVSQFDVRGYPKIMILKAGSPKDVDQAYQYQGAHTASEIVGAVKAEMDGGVTAVQSEEKTEEAAPAATDSTSKTVSVKGQEAWEREVINNPQVTMVAFTAPWCPACQATHPQYDLAASQLYDKDVKLVWVDATDANNYNFVTQFDVRSYPKIMIFKAGSPKDIHQAYQYQGGHGAPDIVNAVLAELQSSQG